MDSVEDQFHYIRTEWNVCKEKWFHGETVDPVFEGMVKDFCTFDSTMQDIYNKVEKFMKGVDQLADARVHVHSLPCHFHGLPQPIEGLANTVANCAVLLMLHPFGRCPRQWVGDETHAIGGMDAVRIPKHNDLPLHLQDVVCAWLRSPSCRRDQVEEEPKGRVNRLPALLDLCLLVHTSQYKLEFLVPTSSL